MRFTSWLENLWRPRRLDRRNCRPLARSVDVLEDRTLLSVSTLFVNGELRVIADADETVEVGTDVDGNVQVTVDGTVDTTIAPVPSASVESLLVIGGDLDNGLDLSGVQSVDYSFQDINGNPLTVRVEAGDGNDSITGTADLGVTIVAGDGDDTVTLLGGDNLVDAGDGDDSVLGGPGGDSVVGGDGHDTLSGGLGDDLLSGDDGIDVVSGGDGQDSITGGDGPDLLNGDDGNDDINGESGRDTIVGGAGDDTLRGGGSNDELYGDSADPLVLGDGNDFVQGQGDEDTIIGGGGADVLLGGPGADLVLSIASDPLSAPPPVPPQPPEPPPPPPLPGFPDAVDSGGGTDSGTTHDMTNGPGDASLVITVDASGGFGTASGVGGDDGGVYDPVGTSPPPATTTFESYIYFRDNTASASGTRATLGNAASNISTIRGQSTEANSTFDVGPLSFALTQTVTPMIDAVGVQTGSLLTQTLRFTNTGSTTQDFEFVRYIDGDLDFDNTLVDGGGRTITGANEEVLFETDRGGSGTTDTTFVGITGKHGTVPTVDRFEIDSYNELQNRIAAGTALDGTITGDNDGDQFVDSGQEYDITLALRNTYSLVAGDSDIYTTHTIFGSGAPSDVGSSGPSATPVAVDDATVTRANTTVEIDVVSNDSDPDGELDYTTVAIATLPTDGVAFSMGDGRISYLPNVDFVGTDTFTYTVTDFNGDVSNPATVTVNVTPPDVGDTLNGNGGDDTVLAGDGNDRLFGGGGDDSLNGSIGNDTISGQGGNDTLVAGTGGDRLVGGDGNDLLDSRPLSTVLVSIDNVRVDPEGDSGQQLATFTVSLVGEFSGTVSVDYTTSDGNAVAGADYIASNGTLSWTSPGNQTISVVVLGDTIDEADEENFFVNLINPVGVLLFDDVGEGRIVDDDDPLATGFGPAVCSGGQTVGTTAALLVGMGDASLSITGITAAGDMSPMDATYDPVGPTAAATTVFRSYVALRTGTTGNRTQLDAGTAQMSGDTSQVLSNFSQDGLDLQLCQQVRSLVDDQGVVNGALLAQTVQLTNPGTATVDLELVRYLDGDLFFDGTLIDGGGRLVTSSGVEILFETDRGGSGSTDTTFVGITGEGGTHPATNRFEFDQFPSLTGTILGGSPLTDTIFNDGDGDQFIDSGSEYDVELGIRNTFSLVAGGTAEYTTHTIFGSGAPTDVTPPSPAPPPPSPPLPVEPLGANVNDTLLGQDGNDTLLSGEGADLVSGGSGRDSVDGGSGPDSLFGGSGDDTLLGGSGEDTLDGQGGADSVHGGADDDTLIWSHGGGSDNLYGDAGADVVLPRGGDGSQVFTVGQNPVDLTFQTLARLQLSDGTHLANVGFDVEEVEFQPGEGSDTITVTDLPDVPGLLVRVNGQGGDDVLSAAGIDPGNVRLNFDGGDGNDTVTGSIRRDTIRGGLGDDQLFGDDGNDSITGGDGDDILDGQDGDDLLLGETGFDTLDGNSGNDVLLGGDDRDSLLGGIGNDTLFGELGDDTLNGKSGDDSILGGEGTDRLFGGNGDDTLDGGRDDDSLYGHNGDDRLLGDHGNDSLKGGNGNDTLIGSDGNDKMYGERGDDQLSGGDGRDTLNGAAGDDILIGGDGNDTLLGGSGRDIALGDLGDDQVKGQGGTRDTIAGGEGADQVLGLASEIDESFSLPASLLGDLDAI